MGLFSATSLDPFASPLPSRFAGSLTDKGKRKLDFSWEDSLPVKKSSTPASSKSSLFIKQQDMDLVVNIDPPVDEDVILADLKSQRKKLHVVNRKQLLKCKKSLCV